MDKILCLIHVIKHDMDPNSNLNYRREIGPLSFPIPKLSISFPHLLALVPATAKDQDNLRV